MLIIRQPPAFQYLPQMNCTQPYAYTFMFAINTLYQFLLFTLSCILCIPFIFCFNCNFAERRKQMNSIQFNSIQLSDCAIMRGKGRQVKATSIIININLKSTSKTSGLSPKFVLETHKFLNILNH